MFKAVVGALGVVPEQVIEEFIVALGEVVIEEQVFVVVQEFLLDGAVEAFGMGIHPQRLGGERSEGACASGPGSARPRRGRSVS